MRKILILSLMALSYLLSMAQTVTFTGQVDDSTNIPLDRIVIINQTKGWHGVLFWPDTVLNMDNVRSIADYSEDNGIILDQNNPNPFEGETEVRLTLENSGDVQMVLAEASGNIKFIQQLPLEPGTHLFHVTTATKGTYLLAALQKNKGASIVLLCDEPGYANRIEYEGFTESMHRVIKQETENLMDVGDIMEYNGYATIDGVEICKYVSEPLDNEQTVPFVYSRAFANAINQVSTPFRVALSLSPFSLNQFLDGYKLIVGNDTAKTAKELQKIYQNLGSTEMYVRVATKRHKTATDITDGKEDPNANVHTYDQAIELCKISNDLKIPINPEIMCAYTYMDMDGTQAPRFDEYPDIYKLQHGKKWEELSLDEICTVLEAYGEFIADSILKYSYKVENWNLGNEANFGFAGIGIGMPNSFDQKLAKAGIMKRYMSSLLGVAWLKKHVWCYEAQTLAAVKRGILKAYKKAGKDASNVKFSTHIATVVSTPRCSASFFEYMAEHGYKMETAGISYYPSAPAMSFNKWSLYTKTVTRIRKKCGVPVFIGEFSYPSGNMQGAFAGWNKQLGSYKKDQQGQADIYTDVISWGKNNGLAGIRYWAPDFEGWYSMSMFEFDNNKVGKAKLILTNHKKILKQ